MTRIDGWILDKFERFAHWTQRTVGIDCRVLASICAIIWVVMLVFGMCFLLSQNKMTGRIICSMDSGFYMDCS